MKVECCISAALVKKNFFVRLSRVLYNSSAIAYNQKCICISDITRCDRSKLLGISWHMGK